jgi:hypothetical protein
MSRLPLLALAAALASCAPGTPRPAPPQAPPPAPVAPPRPLPSPAAADWRDWPMTPGTWSYARDAAGSVASYGTGALPLATLRCDLPNRRVFLSRAGAVATPLTVRTTSLSRQLPAGATGGEPPYAAALLPATDPLLDAIAFSRGRFTLEQAGQPPLVLPAWAEIGRVVEDCRGAP